MTTMTRADRLKRVRELNDRWVTEHLDDASRAFDPADRKDGSDYNLHHVELDADGTAQDAFVADAMRILTPKSFKHLPGQHSQQGHAGISSINAITGIDVMDADSYADSYGDVWDDAGVELGLDGDERGLTARFFERGDLHVVLDLEDGKRQVLEDVDPEGMRQLAYDLEEVLAVDETEFVGGDPYDIVADRDSEKHGFYVAKDGVGDIRIVPPGAEDGDYLELSQEQALEFSEKLLDVADSYEEHLDDFVDGEDVKARVKHPGHPDQSVHGRRRPKGRNLLAGDELDIAALAAMVRESNARTGAGGYDDRGPDDALAAIAHKQGFDRPPRVVSRKQLDARIAAGDRELFRRVGAFGDMSAAELAEQFRTGPAFYGRGEWANGIHATANAERVAKYGTEEGALRMALRADARTATIEQLRALRRDRQDHTNWPSDDIQLFQDLGRFAAALGYDAIEPDDDPRSPWILLNRGAVTVEKASSPAKSFKHLPGRHNQDDHGGDAMPDLGGLDKLKLASRIQLGEGERLLSSRKFKSTGMGSWHLMAAEVDTPNGRQVRLGVIHPDDSRRWSGGPDPKRDARVQEIDAEIARLEEAEGNVDEIDQLSDERSELVGDADEAGLNRTAVLPPSAIAQLRDALVEGEKSARKLSKEVDDFWVKNEHLYDELEKLRNTPWGQLSEADMTRFADLNDIFEAAPDWEVAHAEGVIPAGGEGDLVFSVDGNDRGVGEDSWEVRLGIRPPDADEDWYPGFSDDAALFEPKDVKALLAGLAELAGDQTKAATGRRLSIKRSSTGETMQIKSFQPEVKAVGANGTATIAIATLNVVDKDGDVTLPGFFGEQHAQMVPVHDWNHVPIGKGRVYEKGNQALVDVKFNLAIPEAKNWYEAIKFDKENPPALQEYSYGYEVLEGGSKQGNFKGRAVRYLTPRPDGTAGSKVFEFSPVLLGAGEGTGTVDVKSLARERIAARKARTGAIGLYQGGVAPHETATVARSWDSVKTVAGLPDDALPSHLRTVYAWVDPAGDPELKASYKFPHHHGVAGPANIRACLAGIAELNGATGGVDLSDADRKSVYDHLASHLKDADREPPALRTDVGIPSGKNLRFGDEAANVLAGVAGLIDRASDVMAIRRTKGKAMSANTADLLSWVRDECKRLDVLLSQPIEADDEPSAYVTDEEIASMWLGVIARVQDDN